MRTQPLPSSTVSVPSPTGLPALPLENRSRELGNHLQGERDTHREKELRNEENGEEEEEEEPTLGNQLHSDRESQPCITPSGWPG